MYTDDDDIKQELAKGQKDTVWLIHELLSKKMLSEPQKEIGELEIDLCADQPSYAYAQPMGGPAVSAQAYQPYQP